MRSIPSVNIENIIGYILKSYLFKFKSVCLNSNSIYLNLNLFVIVNLLIFVNLMSDTCLEHVVHINIIGKKSHAQKMCALEKNY